MKTGILLVVAMWYSILFAETEKSFYVEAASGLELAPDQILGDDYTPAAGVFGETSAGWRRNGYSFFLITKRENYAQYSRAAHVTIDYWTYGAGAMFSVWRVGESTRHLDILVHAQAGRADYTLSEDDGDEVKDGSENIVLLTAGSRYYFPVGSRFEFFAGAELSYSSLDYTYPSGYSEDESSPANLNFGGLGGLRLLFP